MLLSIGLFLVSECIVTNCHQILQKVLISKNVLPRKCAVLRKEKAADIFLRILLFSSNIIANNYQVGDTFC